MCCHRLYMYSVCGHSALSPAPLIECRHASIPPGQSHSTSCELIAHPYQSWKLWQLCPPCQQRRDELMGVFEESQVVKFDEWRWKVSYGMPTHGKDYWGKKADERQEEEAASMKSNTKGNRFSLKRKSKSGRKS